MRLKWSIVLNNIFRDPGLPHLGARIKANMQTQPRRRAKPPFIYLLKPKLLKRISFNLTYAKKTRNLYLTDFKIKGLNY